MALFDPMLFFEWLPQIALAGLGLVIAVAVWMVWRTIAPAAPGISMGYYEIMGRYAGRKLLYRIKGTLVDSTSLFLNPEIAGEFKKKIIEDINVVIMKQKTAILKQNEKTSTSLNPSKSTQEPSQTPASASAMVITTLEAIVKQFETCDLSDICRIIVTRGKLFTKHVIVQYGYIDKPLNAYAAHDPSSKFTLSLGFLSQGVIEGSIRTFPQPWEISKLGKATVHLFLPDAEATEQPKMPPDYLAKIAVYASTNVEYRDLIKSKDTQLKEKDKKLSEMGQELSAMATEKDALLRAIQGFSETGKVPKVTIKKFGIPDFVAITVPTLAGYYLSDYVKVEPLVGLFFGLMMGALLLYRRWS